MDLLNKLGPVFGGIFPIAVGFTIISKSIYKIEPGFIGIKYSIFGGVKSHQYKEGYHLAIPFVERPIIYDCKMKNYMFSTEVGTKDLQKISLKTRIILRPNMDNLPQLYRTLGLKYEEKVLNSIIPEICGVVISKYHASQVIANRDTISLLIKKRISEKAKDFSLEVDDTAIIDIKFSKDFEEAIEKKQVAQQEVERTKFLVDQALEEKKSKIIKAVAESEAIKKFGEANQTSSAFLTLRKLDTAQRMSSILKKSDVKLILDTDSFFLNLPKTDKI